LANELSRAPTSKEISRDSLRRGAQIMASSFDWSRALSWRASPARSAAHGCFATRVPVAAIFENLKTSPLEEVLENFHVTREQVQTVLDFAAKSAQTRLEILHVG
jgi:hypothetical protein